MVIGFIFILPIFLGICSLFFNLLLILKYNKLENEKIELIEEINRLDNKIYGGSYVD